MTTMILDLETCVIGWRDIAAAGPPYLPPQAALERARREAITKEVPDHYGAAAGVRWRRKQIDRAGARALEWWAGGALDPKRGEVVCIGYSLDGGEPTVLGIDRSGVKEEVRTFRHLWRVLKDAEPSRVVAHSGDGFDFPFVWERALLQGMPSLAAWFNDAIHYGARQRARLPNHHYGGPKRPALLDSQQLWPTTRGSSNSLQSITTVLGIEEGIDDPLGDGSEVLNALLSGRHMDVKAHCRADIVRLNRLWYDHLVPALGI